jgi:hypothetical protein
MERFGVQSAPVPLSNSENLIDQAVVGLLFIGVVIIVVAGNRFGAIETLSPAKW